MSRTLKKPSAPSMLKLLWEGGFFKTWKNFSQIEARLHELGHHYNGNTLRMALTRAKFITEGGSAILVQYAQKMPAVNKEIDAIEDELFESSMIKKFGSDFETELADLHLNFGRSGNCSAFLLRKILEKLIYITFAKAKLLHKIEDRGVPGRIVGLDAMIKAATQEKGADGRPFLTVNTAKNIEGLKFLGDASAHNPLTEVDMKTILPQMPFIITAYKELLH